MPTVLDGITPADLGLPAHFAEYRQIQRELTDWSLYGPQGSDGPRRFMAAGVAAGSGKSLAAHTIGQMSGVRYVVLTATLALEDQQVADKFQVANVRGRANYPCHFANQLRPDKPMNCEGGREAGCWSPSCPHDLRMEEAGRSRGVLMNYMKWMSSRQHNRAAFAKVEDVGLLICDEAHKAFSELARWLGIWLGSGELRKMAGARATEALKQSGGAEWGFITPAWQQALVAVCAALEEQLAHIAAQYDSEAAAGRESAEYRKLDRKLGEVTRVAALAADAEHNWIWRLTTQGVAFDCVWPARYAERYLWSGVPHVVLMSATLRPKALGMMGIGQAESWFKEWPRVFPAANSPVYWVPTGRMGRSASLDERLRSVAALDRIWELWRDYKGLVHTPSYALAEWFQGQSKHGRHMILSKPGEAGAASDKYRAAGAGAMLISPAFMTGADFPEEDAGYQVIPKLPFPDRSSAVVQARAASDKGWYDYETAQPLQQACGRLTRRPDQKCVTFVLDDAVKGFRFYAREHFSRWFQIKDLLAGKEPGPELIGLTAAHKATPYVEPELTCSYCGAGQLQLAFGYVRINDRLYCRKCEELLENPQNCAHPNNGGVLYACPDCDNIPF
jgi:Helicase C-terminal domain